MPSKTRTRKICLAWAFAAMLGGFDLATVLAQNAEQLQRQQRDDYNRQQKTAVRSQTAPIAQSEANAPFRNVKLSYLQRVDDLIRRMTIDEKIAMVMCDNAAMPKYGIPAFSQYRECLHGVHPFILSGTDMLAKNPKAMDEFCSTVYPHGITMAATWDLPLIYQVADEISDEARAAINGKGSSFFAPNINIFRDPRWGRGQETWGEDPYLTGRFAVAYITGLQGDDPIHAKSLACAKHYAVHSGSEGERFFFNANVSMRDLYDTYLPAFEAAVREAKVGQVMTSYNAVNGIPASLSPLLLTRILRGEWGYEGEVITDAGALNYATTYFHFGTEVENTALALKAGLDADIGGWQRFLGQALQEKRITEEQINAAAKRRLMLLYRLGRMNDPSLDPYAHIPRSVIESKEHLATARQTACEGVVLLKNQGSVLPLSKAIHKLALIGPMSDLALLGTYEGRPSKPVTIARGLAEAFGPAVTIKQVLATDPYAPALPEDLKPLPIEWTTCSTAPQSNRPAHGIWARYYDTRSPELAAETDKKIETSPDFHLYAAAAPQKILPRDFCAIWETTITPPQDMMLVVENQHMTKVRLYVDGKTIIRTRCWNQSNAISNNGGILLKGNTPHTVRLETTSPAFQILVGKPRSLDFNPALQAVSESDAIVLACGFPDNFENEFTDRLSTELPWDQQKMIEAVCAAAGTKPVVLVVSSGSSVAMPWAAEHVPAIVWAGLGGAQAGSALADVLVGNFNPSGRLPITFYASDDQLPPIEDYRMANRTYRYFAGQPQWEFGYGLSYTHFDYSDLRVNASESGSPVTISVKVKNDGSRAGAEICQLYCSHTDAPVTAPQKSLEGFVRVNLKPGEEKTVEFTLTPRQLSLVDEDGERWVLPGTVKLHVGGDQHHGLDGSIVLRCQKTKAPYGYTPPVVR